MLPVSICLTTYNRAPVLAKTLDSILFQSFADFELIISDDCSTDNTEELCRAYESKDSRVRYFRNSKNLKMPGNLNAAIQRANGIYIANLHDGDIYRPDLIAKWKEALDAVPDAPFVFNAYDAFLFDGSRTLYREPFDIRVPGVYIAETYFRSLACCVWGTVMTRSSAYAEHGLFDPTFGFISDVEMWLRLARGRDIAYIPEPLITVTPREQDHPFAPFARYYWQHLFWQFGIYNKHIDDYKKMFPNRIAPFSDDYRSMLRRVFLRAMLSAVKHRKWARVCEGLAIWKDSADPVLRFLGSAPAHRWQPAWYDPSWWSMARTSPPFVASAKSQGS